MTHDTVPAPEAIKDLQTDQKRSALADYFKEIIYGGIDGIVTTFAVVSGAAGASLSSNETTQLLFLSVLLFGLANLFADAASMGLGNFLSVRSEKDLYASKRATEERLLTEQPEQEITQTISILVSKGFSVEQAHIMANLYKTNHEYWADFMMQHELELSDPRGENEVFTGLATFSSFLVFGSIPLLPFIFPSELNSQIIFFYSAFGTFCALVVLGLLKWRVIGTRLISSLTEVVLVGGTAAVLAYIVGTFFAL